MAEIKYLEGHNSFPVAAATFAEGEAGLNPEKFRMHYVWVFSYIMEEYMPIAVFHQKGEADKYLAAIKATMPKGRFSGAVLELSWDEFMHKAADSKLGELKDAMVLLGQFTKDLGKLEAKKVRHYHIRSGRPIIRYWRY